MSDNQNATHLLTKKGKQHHTGPNSLVTQQSTLSSRQITMKFVSLAVSVLALYSTIANAWMEDERCKIRRQLIGNLDEEGGVPNDLSEESAISVNENLRGSDADPIVNSGSTPFD